VEFHECNLKICFSANKTCSGVNFKNEIAENVDDFFD